MTRRSYITTAIPYVNAAPHLGFALELVQADVLARHHRSRGWAVRFQSGTDDNSLKNVHAAAAAGVDVRDLVDRNADGFASLREPLALSLDDFVRTSSDPRHRPGVEWLWRACDAKGDLYRRHYEGWYCVGCEQFYAPADLTSEGHCPEHGVRPELLAEENWFFRLSRYEAAVHELIASDRLRIQPESRPGRGRRAAAVRAVVGRSAPCAVRRPARHRPAGSGPAVRPPPHSRRTHGRNSTVDASSSRGSAE